MAIRSARARYAYAHVNMLGTPLAWRCRVRAKRKTARCCHRLRTTATAQGRATPQRPDRRSRPCAPAGGAGVRRRRRGKASEGHAGGGQSLSALYVGGSCGQVPQCASPTTGAGPGGERLHCCCCSTRACQGSKDSRAAPASDDVTSCRTLGLHQRPCGAAAVGRRTLPTAHRHGAKEREGLGRSDVASVSARRFATRRKAGRHRGL